MRPKVRAPTPLLLRISLLACSVMAGSGEPSSHASSLRVDAAQVSAAECRVELIHSTETTLGDGSVSQVLRVLSASLEAPVAPPRNNPAPTAFAQKIIERMGPAVLDPLYVLRRERSLWAADNGNSQDLRVHVALEARPELVRPVACWESWLMDAHDARFSVDLGPSEFVAALMSPNDKGESEIFVVSGPQPSASLGSLSTQILSRVQGGQRVLSFLHNHPWNLLNVNDAAASWGGSLAPSPMDLQTFAPLFTQWNLQRASVTNGLHTVDLDAAAVRELSRAAGLPSDF